MKKKYKLKEIEKRMTYLTNFRIEIKIDEIYDKIVMPGRIEFKST